MVEDVGASQGDRAGGAAHPSPAVSAKGAHPSRVEAVEPDEVVWLRDLDGTGSMHPCAPHDPGAIRYIREDLT